MTTIYHSFFKWCCKKHYHDNNSIED